MRRDLSTYSGCPWQYQNIQTDARLLYHDLSDTNEIKYLLAEVTTFAVGGDEIFSSPEPVTATGTYAGMPIDLQPPTITGWSSAAAHGRGVGLARLEITEDGNFVEPRSGGIQLLLLEFSEPIDPASLIAQNVEFAGLDANNNSLNLAGLSITTLTIEDDTVGLLDLSEPLPDCARYVVQISGVTDTVGNELAGDTDRTMTALVGDVSGDRLVNSTDLTKVRNARTKVVDPQQPEQVRADVSQDGRVNATDMSRVRARRSNDARGIAEPVIGQ